MTETISTGGSTGTASSGYMQVLENTWKYCPNCGKKLEAEWKFCADCGTKVTNESYPTWPTPWYPYYPSYPTYPIYPQEPWRITWCSNQQSARNQDAPMDPIVHGIL